MGLPFFLDGKAHEMGLRPASIYSLTEARELRDAARKLRHKRVNPIEERRIRIMQERLETAKAFSFQECATRYIDRTVLAGVISSMASNGHPHYATTFSQSSAL
jgi:hypothetical protein